MAGPFSHGGYELKLTEEDAALIKGMLKRGDPQMQIAIYFSVNQARISEINKGRVHANVKAAPPYLLPPEPPYVMISEADHKAAQAALQIVHAFFQDIDAVVERYKKSAFISEVLSQSKAVDPEKAVST